PRPQTPEYHHRHSSYPGSLVRCSGLFGNFLKIKRFATLRWEEMFTILNQEQRMEKAGKGSVQQYRPRRHSLCTECPEGRQGEVAAGTAFAVIGAARSWVAVQLRNGPFLPLPLSVAVMTG